MFDAYIYDAARTAIGKRRGTLARIRPDDLAAKCLSAIVERNGFYKGEVEDVIMGCVTQIGEQGYNIGRLAPLIAGFPVTTTGTTVNRMCASSLQAINFAAQGVMSGMHDLVIGAGVESMTRVPMGTDGSSLSDELLDRYDIIGQGLSAELIAKKWDISREALDDFAYESHQRAFSAIDAGKFENEILKIEVPDKEGKFTRFENDEGPRKSTREKLSGLKPCFKDDGVITAASSSQISDGASAVLVGSEIVGQKLGIAPKAKIIGMSVAGVDPTIMLTGPIPATQKVLAKTGLKMEDIGLFEVNEAFGSVVLAWAKDISGPLGTEKLLERTNVNGGAIALGHPLGCSGARLLTTLLWEMEKRDVRYGLVTLCIGHGMAVATIIDRKV